MTKKLFIDWETFYDSKAGFDLKEISTTEYVRSPKFKAHGLAYQWEGGERAHWVVGAHAISAFIASVDWKSTVVVAHSAKFDVAILAWRFGIKAASYICTQALAEAVLGEWVPNHKLATLARYLGLPDKGEISCDGVRGPSEEQLRALGDYCIHDVELCKGIHDKIIGKFPESQLWHMDWTIRCFVEPVLELNQAVLEKGVKDETKRREQAIALSGLTKEQLSSNKQFAEHLQSVGIAVVTKRSTRTGKDIPAFAKTDAGLEALRHTHPALYEARLAAKSTILETRGKALLAVAKTGPFPCDIEFSGATDTHRYSGRSGAGGNFQNFTRGSFLRRAVEAPEGSELVVGDLAKIDLTILAWLAKEPKLMDALRNGGSPYADFSTGFYHRPIMKKNVVEYHFGKCSILGLGYQMGKTRFFDTVKGLQPDASFTPEQVAALEELKQSFTEDDAWRTVQFYRKTYPNVPALWQKCQDSIPLIAEGRVGCLFFAPFIKVRKGALVLPSGLEIKYPSLRFGEYYDRKAKEVVEGWHYDAYFKVGEPEPVGLYGGKITADLCQALTGELCKAAIRRAEDNGIPCKGQVHDEVLAVVPQERAEWAVKMLESIMAVPPTWLADMKVKGEVKHAKDWLTAK